MFLFKDTINRDKETVQMWKDRCKKLERDNNKLRSELESVRQYKEDYEDLIGSLDLIKRRYEYLVNQAEELETLYKEELDNILSVSKEISAENN